MMSDKRMLHLVLLAAILHLSSCDITLDANTWKSVILPAGVTRVSFPGFNPLNPMYSSAVIQVSALESLCISSSSSCVNGKSFRGTSVGIELFKNTFPQALLYIISNRSQRALVSLRVYNAAPIVGACPGIPDVLNPNIDVKSSATVHTLSFTYATLLVSNELLACNDKSYWSQLRYDLYALPWNQRYVQPNPNFNSSSILSLAEAVKQASSLNILSSGTLLRTPRMKNVERPARFFLFSRQGLDVLLALRVGFRDPSPSDESAFHVPFILPGCNESSCAIVSSLWARVFVGIAALFWLLWTHLARRYHRINTFGSGYIIGSLMTYTLLTQFSGLEAVPCIIISLVAAGPLGALVVMFIFWRVRQSRKLSHLPLYLCTSFLLTGIVFFTPLGNQPFWNDFGVFCAVFYGIIGVFTILVCPPLTEKGAVDACVSLVGSYAFLFGVAVVFLPGSVFPYVLLDNISRIAVPGAHGALGIAWTSLEDIALFATWPALTLIIFLFNFCCTPPLAPRPRPSSQESLSSPSNWTPADSWPPLPPAAYASERTPLLTPGGNAPNVDEMPEPPPYMNSNDRPPSYRP